MNEYRNGPRIPFAAPGMHSVGVTGQCLYCQWYGNVECWPTCYSQEGPRAEYRRCPNCKADGTVTLLTEEPKRKKRNHFIGH